MPHPITRAINFMNQLQKLRSSDAASVGRGLYSIAFSPTHFPKTLSAIMFTSLISGYMTMATIHNNSLKRRDEMYANAWSQNGQTEMHPSDNTLLVRAMVEKAKSSSMRENIENAAAAQEEFMRLSMKTEQTKEDGKTVLRRITRRMTRPEDRSRL